jgi:hypothetical protein
MDSTEVIRDNADSLELSRTSKGEFSYKVKVYGDSSSADGCIDMEKRVIALKYKVEGIIDDTKKETI